MKSAFTRRGQMMMLDHPKLMMLDHPKGIKRRLQRKRQLLRRKNTVEEEAEEGCCCSSSKGCEKPDGHVLWRTLRLMVHFQIFCDLCFVI